MSNKHTVEYTDTCSGEANYAWVKRATITMPELTHYGYDGSGHTYARANRIYQRELMRRAKKEMGLTGVRGQRCDVCGTIEFRPRGCNTVLFVFDCED